MKLTISTSPKEFELQNYVLGQLMRMLEAAQPDQHSFTEAEINAAKKFRNKLLKAFLATT